MYCEHKTFRAEEGGGPQLGLIRALPIVLPSIWLE